MLLRQMAVVAGIALGMGSVQAEWPSLFKKSERKTEMTADEVFAELIACTIASQEACKGAKLEFSVSTGEVVVIGTCKDHMQKAAVLEVVCSMDGVKLVVEGVTVNGTDSWTQVPIVTIPTSGRQPALQHYWRYKFGY